MQLIGKNLTIPGHKLSLYFTATFWTLLHPLLLDGIKFREYSVPHPNQKLVWEKVIKIGSYIVYQTSYIF